MQWDVINLDERDGRHRRSRRRHLRRRRARPTSWRASSTGSWPSVAPAPTRPSARRGGAHDQEAVQAEGHRPRPPGLEQGSAHARRRRRLRPAAARPRHRAAEEGARGWRCGRRCRRSAPTGELVVLDTRRAQRAEDQDAGRCIWASSAGASRWSSTARRSRRISPGRRAIWSAVDVLPSARRQRLRHPAPRHAGADPRRGRQADGAPGMSKPYRRARRSRVGTGARVRGGAPAGDHREGDADLRAQSGGLPGGASTRPSRRSRRRSRCCSRSR